MIQYLEYFEYLEKRLCLSSYSQYNPSIDIPPKAPSNVSATLVVIKNQKFVQVKWSDNSTNEDWFNILVAKGKNPIGNVWSTKQIVGGFKSTTGRIIVNIPYTKGFSWAVQSYRDTPKSDIYRWSVGVPILGVFVQ